MEGHREWCERQHHSLFHIALLKAFTAGPLPEALPTLLQHAYAQTELLTGMQST